MSTRSARPLRSDALVPGLLFHALSLAGRINDDEYGAIAPALDPVGRSVDNDPAHRGTDAATRAEERAARALAGSPHVAGLLQAVNTGAGLPSADDATRVQRHPAAGRDRRGDDPERSQDPSSVPLKPPLNLGWQSQHPLWNLRTDVLPVAGTMLPCRCPMEQTGRKCSSTGNSIPKISAVDDPERAVHRSR
jgi:hypothetical protein